MKTFTKIFMAVVALFAFACTTDTTFDQTVELGAGQTTITLSLDEESRTHITGKNGEEYPLYWSEGAQQSSRERYPSTQSATPPR